MSAARGARRPPTMPLTPAMRPFSSTSIAAAAPMSAPPASEVHGVKCAQSITGARLRLFRLRGLERREKLTRRCRIYRLGRGLAGARGEHRGELPDAAGGGGAAGEGPALGRAPRG